MKILIFFQTTLFRNTVGETWMQCTLENQFTGGHQNIFEGFDHLFHDKKILAYHKTHAKSVHTLCVRREWNHETVPTVHRGSAQVKECCCVEEKRAVKHPEQQRSLNHIGLLCIHADGDITQPYVSGAGVTSSPSLSRGLKHWRCSERFKEFEALVPCGTLVLFSSTKNKK